MRTANRESLEGKDPLIKNGGDFVFRHSFAAGLVNVSAAVQQASTWTNLGELVVNTKEDATPAALPNNGKDFVVAESDLSDSNLRVEHVEVTFTIKHSVRGELGFVITSPSGMESIAQRRPNDDNADFVDYTPTSVMHWGETSTGKWKVAVLDRVANLSLTRVKVPQPRGFYLFFPLPRQPP